VNTTFGDAIPIGRWFPRKKPYSFMISVEIKPELVKCYNVMPRAPLLRLKDLQ
jgi:hypothetical protein